MAILRYFLSDTGIIRGQFRDDMEAAVQTATLLGLLPDYRQCTMAEYQAKRRWQARQERKEAATDTGTGANLEGEKVRS